MSLINQQKNRTCPVTCAVVGQKAGRRHGGGASERAVVEETWRGQQRGEAATWGRAREAAPWGAARGWLHGVVGSLSCMAEEVARHLNARWRRPASMEQAAGGFLEATGVGARCGHNRDQAGRNGRRCVYSAAEWVATARGAAGGDGKFR